MSETDKLKTTFQRETPFKHQSSEKAASAGQPHALIQQRIEELKRFAEEDGGQPPLSASEESLLHFLSMFNIASLPEITLTDDGCYYLRIVNGRNKLVVHFLADTTIQYLIESNTGYLENISAIAFFQDQHSSFVRESIL